MTGPGSRNVLLRPIAEDDWSAVHAWASQERVCRYQPWGPNTIEQTREFVRGAAHAWASIPRTRLVYAITLHGSVIGNCDLNLRGQGQGEISYVLHPDYWGKGLATAAARQLVQLGLDEHNLHRIFATCDPRNIASAAVLQRLGMHYEGRMRETMLIRDGWRDSDLYSLLVHEWHDQVSPTRPDNAPSGSGNARSAPI
jgi:[ribosomal protein S5]-alanine N-acetyltransferase